MMFKIRSFLFSLLLTLGVFKAPVRNKSALKEISFTSFNLVENINEFKLSVLAFAAIPLTVSVFIVNDLYPDGVKIYQETFNASIETSFSYDNRYTRSKNNSVLIKEATSSKEKTEMHEVTTYTSSIKRISGSEFSYESNANLYLYTSKDGWSVTKEKLNFINFDDTYIPDYYHKVDLSDFKISFNNAISEDIIFESGLFIINNYNGAFNKYTNEPELQLPLVLVKETTNRYYLRFENLLYVDKYSLELCSAETEDTVKTYQFYFPRDKKQDEEGYNIRIVLNGMGVDYSKFLVDFKYKSIDNIFGDCHNSKYCIVTS